MSKITNNGLTRSGTGCFIAAHVWQQRASKGSSNTTVRTATLPPFDWLHGYVLISSRSRRCPKYHAVWCGVCDCCCRSGRGNSISTAKDASCRMGGVGNWRRRISTYYWRQTNSSFMLTDSSYRQEYGFPTSDCFSFIFNQISELVKLLSRSMHSAVHSIFWRKLEELSCE